MDNSHGALIAKARAVYSNRLSEADYNNLLRRGSLNSAVAYLKGTKRYARVLGNISETQAQRGRVESILKKDVFDIYMRLNRFIPDNPRGLQSFAARRLETESVYNVIIFIGIGEFDRIAAYLPEYLAPYASFDFMSLANVKGYDALLNVLKDTRYYKVLKPVCASGSPDVNEAAKALFGDYYDWSWDAVEKEFAGTAESELKELLLRQAELDVLLSAYRMKTYFNATVSEVANAVYRSRRYSRVLNEVLANYGEAEEKIIAILNKRFFKNKITIDKDNLETAIRLDSLNYYRKLLRMSENGLTVLYALYGLLETERQNVTAIIESMRYSLPVAETERLIAI